MILPTASLKHLAGVVILYHPEKSCFENILTYFNFLDKFYIFDNTEGPCDSYDIIKDLEGVRYIKNGQNLGIGVCLNLAAKYAYEDGIDWLLTMDQDSSFKSEDLNSYLIRINNFKDRNTVAMFGCNFESEIVSVKSSEPSLMLITSGSVVNMQIFNQLGGFDENLFIDLIDHEYCFRAFIRGYCSIKFNDIFLKHHLGSKKTYYFFYYFSTTRNLHNNLRIYYMLRNYFYLKKKYTSYFNKEFNQIWFDILNRIKNNLLFDKNRMELLSLILRGYTDFKAGRMGKFVK